MRLAIFCALRWECRPVLKALRQVRRQRIGRFKVWTAKADPGDVVVVQTGVGVERAREAARALSAHADFDLFLSAGCAGALDTVLRPGDLVAARRIVADSVPFDGDAVFETHATETCARLSLPFRCGTILTSPVALTTVSARHQAAARSGAIAVAMEAVGIAEIAAEHGIAVAEIRAILDAADVELHESGDFMNPETGKLRALELLRYLATHPSSVSQFWALRRMMAMAETSLERFFAAYLPPSVH